MSRAERKGPNADQRQARRAEGKGLNATEHQMHRAERKGPDADERQARREEGEGLKTHRQELAGRFSETRRPQPLAPDRSVSEGIRDERSRLNVIREMADEIVDTSDMTVHELRQFFMSLSRDRARARLVITLLSFGYKHGVPVDADLVFDVRCLPNPHFVATLRRRTGRDRVVAEFMERDPAAREFMDRLEEYLRYVVPFYIAEGKSYLTVGIGCTGGRHRSVMIAERLKRPLAALGVARVRVRHRDLAHA